MGDHAVAIIIGSDNDDIQVGGAGRDTIWGKRGNDTLYGGGGADALYGGDGNDIFFPENLYRFDTGIDTAVPAAGDRMDGGNGTDMVDYGRVAITRGTTTRIDLDNTRASTGVAAGDTFVSIENVRGSTGDDQIFGGEATDNLFAATWGLDLYDGRGGSDRYVGLQLSGPVVAYDTTLKNPRLEMQLVHGAEAQALVGPKVKLLAGEAVAFYTGYEDLDADGVQDADEPSLSFYHRLQNIEEYAGSSVNDVLNGTAGDDYFVTSGGRDILRGGDGTDTIELSNANYVDLAAGEYSGGTLSSIENVIGGQFGDEIYGSLAGNRMIGNGGSDMLDGLGGSDVLVGGAGDDILIGGIGADILAGGAGADMLDGGAGEDLISYADSATSIAVSLIKRSGLLPIIDDVTILDAESAGDSLTSVENVDGSRFADVIYGGRSGNILTGLAGSDLILGCNGNDVIWGEADPDRILPVLTDPRDATTDDDCGCDDDEDDHGSDEPGGDAANTGDDLRGGNGNDTLYGGLGADVLSGGCDDDLLDGGTGTDLLYGGQGNDVLNGGAGFDFLFGGIGEDTVTYAASAAGVTVDLENFWNNSGGDAAADLITDILLLLAEGEGSDAALGSASFLSLITMLGSDDDTTMFSLAIPDVTIGVEHAVGSAFDDVLRGDAGANRLTGGAGRDTLTGGGGADRFVFGAGDAGATLAAADRITDFSRGADRIDLSAIDAIVGGKDQAFTFIGSAAFGGKAGQLRFETTGDGLLVSGDTNGDGKADLMIVVSGAATLTAGDFVL